MNAKLNGKIWVVDVTAKQFRNMVEEFFKQNPIPSSDELKRALVPVGVPNTADERDFGPCGIFKYCFVSSDGIRLMVKYHRQDKKLALRSPKANAARFWTTQIICDDYLFFGWKNHKASTTIVGEDKILSGTAPKEDRFHIPLRDDPSDGSSGQAISFKAEQANDETPDSFDLYRFLINFLLFFHHNINNILNKTNLSINKIFSIIENNNVFNYYTSLLIYSIYLP